jgi:hypothetical protein
MKSKHFSLFVLFSILILSGCSNRKNLIGKWKVIDFNLEKNNLIDKNTFIVFDPDGFITFNNGSAARGEWDMNTSTSILTISLYGKALQHDVEIKGEYDFSSDKLIITAIEDETKKLLELDKVELEPAK